MTPRGTRVPPGTTTSAAYPGHVQILLWLVPPLVATLVAMAWASWASRDTAEADPEQAAARLERALSERPPVRYAPRRPPVSDGGHGVAVRPAREPALRPLPEPAPEPAPEVVVRRTPEAPAAPDQDDEATPTRQAS
jgi:hypothetical protein